MVRSSDEPGNALVQSEERKIQAHVDGIERIVAGDPRHDWAADRRRMRELAVRSSGSGIVVDEDSKG